MIDTTFFSETGRVAATIETIYSISFSSQFTLSKTACISLSFSAERIFVTGTSFALPAYHIKEPTSTEIKEPNFDGNENKSDKQTF